MSDDKCPNCGGELISRVSFVDYCLDCDTTIDASYWQTRAYVAEEHAKRSDAQVAALQTTLTDAINIDIEKTRELRETRAALREANEDAQACAAFLEIALKYTRDIGHPFNVAEINAALRAHAPAWEAWKNECK